VHLKVTEKIAILKNIFEQTISGVLINGQEMIAVTTGLGGKFPVTEKTLSEHLHNFNNSLM
jgi:hypothetical protein